MTPTPSSTVADSLFGVGHRLSGDPAQLDLVVPTCEQAWEAMRHRMLVALQAAGRDEARGLEVALRALAATGPSREGWHCCVADVEYWYGPAPIRRPREVTLGEAALLVAVGAGRRLGDGGGGHHDLRYR